MTACSMPPFGHCSEPASVTVRIDRVGDRALCARHLAQIEAMGMAYRRLDAAIPAWRQRALGRDMSRSVA